MRNYVLNEKTTRVILVHIYVFLQEITDIYLFGIVAILVLFDVVFMVPPTIVSKAILRREETELEGEKVSHNYSCMYIH